MSDLADEFSVTTRTIRKDLNERLSHLNIVCKNGLYFLENLPNIKDYELVNFSKKSGIYGLYPHFKNLDTNLVKGYKYEKIDEILFKQIQNAILENLTLNFSYNAKNRAVNPYKLINLNGIWYLVATQNGVIKNFTLDKISNLEISNKFNKDTKIIKFIEENHQTFISQNLTTIKLKANKKIREFLLRRDIFPNQKIVNELENGDIIFEIKASFIPEILGIISYWIPHISIIEPHYLRDELLENLKIYLEKETQCF